MAANRALLRVAKAEAAALAFSALSLLLLLAAQPEYEPPAEPAREPPNDAPLAAMLEFEGEYASFYAAGEHWVVHGSELLKYGYGGI